MVQHVQVYIVGFVVVVALIGLISEQDPSITGDIKIKIPFKPRGAPGIPLSSEVVCETELNPITVLGLSLPDDIKMYCLGINPPFPRGDFDPRGVFRQGSGMQINVPMDLQKQRKFLDSASFNMQTGPYNPRTGATPTILTCRLACQDPDIYIEARKVKQCAFKESIPGTSLQRFREKYLTAKKVC